LEKDSAKERVPLLSKLVHLRKELAQLKASERKHQQTKEALQKRTHALGERVKELNCLYAISNLVEKQNLSLGEILAATANLIPPAWQYPDVTSARINVLRHTFKTGNFKESRWRQSSDIFVRGKKEGSLDVCYLKERPESDEGPFLKEERNLINVIAKRIGEIIERRQAEDALKESLARNKALLNAIPDLIFRINKDGIILDFKKGKAFGKKVLTNRLLSENVYTLPDYYRVVTKETVQIGMKHVEQALQTGKTQIYEQRVVHKKDVYHYEVVITLSGEEEVLGIIRDITERRRLERQVLEISEWEQRRIGQDLHDSLCQHLAGIAFMGKVLEQNIAGKALDEAGSAAEIVSLLDDAITQTKGFARGLYPVRLDANGLMMALSELSDNVGKLFGVACRFTYDEPVLIHDSIMAIHLYRIIQEAVNNGIKHGKATDILINFSHANGATVLTVRNNGHGFGSTSEEGKGMGISIMKYRASMIGASLDIKSDVKRGTVVVCSFKVKKTNRRAGI
jgi:signal transduction histidine kinase